MLIAAVLFYGLFTVLETFRNGKLYGLLGILLFYIALWLRFLQCPAAGNGDDGKQLPEAVYELQWNHADALELQCVSGRDRKRFVLYHLCSDPGRSAAGGTGNVRSFTANADLSCLSL